MATTNSTAIDIMNILCSLLRGISSKKLKPSYVSGLDGNYTNDINILTQGAVIEVTASEVIYKHAAIVSYSPYSFGSVNSLNSIRSNCKTTILKASGTGSLLVTLSKVFRTLSILSSDSP